MTTPAPRLNTVILLTPDVSRARAFYADLLGLPLLSDEYGMVTLDLGGPALLLHPAEATQQAGAGQPQGLGLQLSVPDVDALAARLGAAGHAVTDPTDQDYGVREATVTDPDGHPVTLAQPL
jgi:lactoylglutathione lyase